jgi:hypothetical protein
MSSVFLSHNSKDKPWVRNLAERLISDGVAVWLDEAEINIGDSLIDKISSGINDMQFVAAIISSNSIESRWVQKELSIAMSKEVSSCAVTVLPIVIEKCSLPTSLSDKLYADFTDPLKFEAEYSKLLRAIGIQKDSSFTRISSTNLSAVKNAPNTPKNRQLDIRIIGILKERTRQDRQYSGLQDYFLQLSAKPPRGWERFFNESRRFPRHSMWREAWIENDCVVVKCVIDELSRYHLNDLKQDVANANENFIRAVRDEELKRKREPDRLEQARIERDKSLDDLDFS